MPTNPFLSVRKVAPIVVGHRGVPTLHQENTLAGFRRAVALGVPGVELDVRLSRDGFAVLSHDDDLSRLTGEQGRISRMTWDEISRLRIRRRLPMGIDCHGAPVIIDYEKEERIPLLSEVLAEVGDKLLFNVELKLDGPSWSVDVAAAAAREIEQYRMQSRAVVTSFDLRKLRETRRRTPRQPTGFCFDGDMLGVLGPLQNWLGQSGSHAVLRHVLRSHWSRFIARTEVVGIDHVLLSKSEVQSMREHGLAVGTYTLFPVGSTTGKKISPAASDPAEVRRLIELGVDWIETDDRSDYWSSYRKNAKGGWLMLLVRGLVGGFFQIALFALLLLLPANLLAEGSWRWPRAWCFLGAYGLLQVVAITLFAFVAPRSLEARLARGSKKQPKADRIILGVFVVLFTAWFAFIPIDVFYLRIWSAPSLVGSACGALISLLGYLIVLATIYQNEYAKPIVEVQDERGHEVIDTGLYAVVRHPMYMGVFPWVGGLALWLESYASAVLGLLLCCILVVRIRVEENTLRKDLKGYEEYAKRVKYRLIPFVW